jgi:hypothetical protein
VSILWFASIFVLIKEKQKEEEKLQQQSHVAGERKGVKHY